MKKESSLTGNADNEYEKLSDTNESIQEQFKSYQNEIDFEIKLNDDRKIKKTTNHKQS